MLKQIMGTILAIGMSLVAGEAAAARAADGLVWVVKAHPAKACAEAYDGKTDEEALRLDRSGIAVQDTVLGIDRARRDAKPDCGKPGFYVMAVLISESDVARVQPMGYKRASPEFSKSNPEL